MNSDSSMLLLGIGTAGSAIARGVCRSFDDGLRYLLADTDAATGQNGESFVLLGGDRLSGHGAGGDVVAGRLAVEDSLHTLDEHVQGVRLAVIVTSLGGGTGGGGTLETAKYLVNKGIATIVFATMPFTFEGEDRQRNARGIAGLIEEAANATFYLPLDKLVGDVANMNEAMQQAVSTVASGVTLFWRLVEKPGYIRLDAERLRHLLSGAGRGRFAVTTVQGENRASEAVNQLIRSELLATSSEPVHSILCGILGGNDLLLNEVGTIADGVRNAFGGLVFELATVNDEQTFSGRLSIVVMLFESGTKVANPDHPGSVMSTRRHKNKGVLSSGPNGRGRFKNAEPTIWNGEDLDVPTFIRRNISLDL